MSPSNPVERTRTNDAAIDRHLGRRRFLALGAGTGTALLAGCSTASDSSGPDDGGSEPGGADPAASSASTFRLLISDQPVAIGDFDELNVSLDRARVFRGEGDDDAEAESTDASAPTTAEPESTPAEPASTTESDGTNTADTEPAASPSSTITPAATDVESELEEDDPDDGDQPGFTVIELDGVTVDLTQVVGDKAIGVFEGELEAGRYTKIELYASGVEGIVNGDPVDVMIPSGKLQIVKPFELVAGETVSFVFDINVVKKGRSGEYNLLPVISESGVAGQDVDVEEVGTDKPDSAGSDDAESDAPVTGEPNADEEETEGDDADGAEAPQGDGPPDDAGIDS